MRAKLIYNPASRGAVGPWRQRRIERALLAGGIETEVCTAVRPGDARQYAVSARDGSCGMVLCAGGDGTINEVINGIAGSNLLLGILPMGTGNVLAWELGIPLDPLGACAVVTGGMERTIDLGRSSGGHYFSCMTGVGIDAQIVREVTPAAKGLLGSLAYLIGGIGTLIHHGLTELSIEMDGRKPPVVGYATVICNAARYGGRFRLCPAAVIDDGWFDVCILQKRDSLALLRSGISVIMNNHQRMQGISFTRARSVLVSSSQKVLVQSDGDIIGATPMGFSIAPRALRVMVPRVEGRGGAA